MGIGTTHCQRLWMPFRAQKVAAENHGGCTGANTTYLLLIRRAEEPLSVSESNPLITAPKDLHERVDLDNSRNRHRVCFGRHYSSVDPPNTFRSVSSPVFKKTMRVLFVLLDSPPLPFLSATPLYKDKLQLRPHRCARRKPRAHGGYPQIAKTTAVAVRKIR